MNIQHFEMLQKMFENHAKDHNQEGFTISEFRDSFSSIFKGQLSYNQMTMLFMKIDANSGTCWHLY